MKDSKTKIFIAEDYPLFIEALMSKLKIYSDEFECIGYALNGEDAIKKMENKTIDILILDIGMPKMNGLEVLKYISINFPEIKVLVLTMYDDLKHIREMLSAGAKGYILKNTIGKNVIEALRNLRDGRDYLQEEVAQVGARSLMKNHDEKYVDIEYIKKSLRNDEVKLLQLLTLEFTAKELADRMCVSSKTIETYKKNLAKKLNVKGGLGLVRFAVENGFTMDKD
ncbi:MAG: response regulator transcription factor [Flavobacteriales bacterium]|jgi:DNA-binding NarL/FixJ family response regulator|nr:response regulator transcription factor [Flavobacteriales bacterium]